MKENRLVIFLSVLLAVMLVVLVAVSIGSVKKGIEKLQTKIEESTEEETQTETEIESEVPVEVQTQTMTSTGGTEDEKFYEALVCIDQERTDMYATAVADLTELADGGNIDAQYILGEMYLQGIGVGADMDKAAEYIKLAYDGGNEKSFDIYGKLRFMGDGLPQDYEEAYAALRMVTDERREVNCALGIMHTYGLGVRIDYDIAKSYLDKAIEQGSTIAQSVKNKIGSLTYKRRDSETATSVPAKTIVRTDYSTSDVAGLDELLAKVYESISSSQDYSAFTDELKAMAEADPSTVSSIAIFGKDNWLFFQNENDGDSYHDYVGDNMFTDAQLESIKANLEKQEKKANAAGAEFVVLIYPNKEAIYSEKMPSYIQRQSEVSRTDKLVEYLRQNSDITVIYPKEEYISLKDEYQLYYATDTHCNMVGTFISLKDVLNEVYSKDLSLDLSKFAIHSTEYAGDIGVMIGRDDRYDFDTVYFLPESAAGLKDKVSDSMTLIGDSFSEFLNIEAGYYFGGGVNHYMVSEYSYNYNSAMDAALANSKADIIVWECAERCIDRLD